MITLALALRDAVQRLQAAGIDSAPRDARLLLAHATGIPADRLTLHLQDPLPTDAAKGFEAAILARSRHQPVSQITGSRNFWGRSFRVTQDVLDPRPETEVLVAEALKAPFARVLDLGTGSGAILLSLLADRPSAIGLGCDLSPAALQVAQDNARRLGLQADFLISDWFAAIPPQAFDLIVSNPPYIAADEMAALSPDVREWEPHLALTPGGDGLDAYRAIAKGAPAYLRPGGRLMVEIGPTQGRAVSDLFAAAGLVGVQVLPDLDGRDRVVCARKAGD